MLGLRDVNLEQVEQVTVDPPWLVDALPRSFAARLPYFFHG